MSEWMPRISRGEDAMFQLSEDTGDKIILIILIIIAGVSLLLLPTMLAHATPTDRLPRCYLNGSCCSWDNSSCWSDDAGI